METLESLSRRIGSTEELASLVGTMKALSSVNIRQYERAVASIRDYDATVERGLHVVLRARGFGQERRTPGPRRSAAFVFGSDHGLCGRFNDESAEFALERLDRLGVAPEDRVLAAVGARAAARLRDLDAPADTELAAPGSVAGLEEAVRDILVRVDRWREARGVWRVLLVYRRHRADDDQRLHAEQLLPIELERFRRLAGRPWPSRRIPTFTMEAEALLAALLRQYLFVAVYRAFAESAASEHASRVETMQAAERNLDERLDALHAELHRRRQDAITAELLDVVSGFEALTADDGGS